MLEKFNKAFTLGMYFLHVGLFRRKMVFLDRTHEGIGDLVCLLSCISGLRQRFPRSWIVLSVPLGVLPLARTSNLADGVVSQGSFSHHFFLNRVKAGNHFRPFLPDEETPPKPRLAIHLAQEFGCLLGVKPDLNSVFFKVPNPDRRHLAKKLCRVNPRNLPVIVVHTGPTWQVKEWPVEAWKELGSCIGEKISACMVQIGRDWHGFENQNRQSPRVPGATDWVNELRLTEMVALLELATLFIGIDSGPLHLATNLGIPSIGLFGPTLGECFLNPRARAQNLHSRVDCLGCHHLPQGPLHWRQNCPHQIQCMKSLSVQEVFFAVEKMFLESVGSGFPNNSGPPTVFSIA